MWKWIKALNPFAVELRNTEARLEFARVLLAQAEIELADKAFYVREFAAVSKERDELRVGWQNSHKAEDELETARAQLAAAEIELADLRFYQREFAAVSAERDELRERASVPVKVRFGCGVGDVMRHINSASANSHHISLAMDYLAAHAVIDAPAGVPSDPPAGQVEALARVLRAAYMKECHVEPSDCLPNRGYLAEARAAIAHLATRPEGLPTADILAQIYNRVYYDSAPEGCRVNWEFIPEACREDMVRGTEAILTALRPWLRDPMGFELDVTADELTAKLWGFFDADKMSNEILDLCRKRIRPVYECKECAKCEAECRQWRNANDELVRRAAAARAALEGE